MSPTKHVERSDVGVSLTVKLKRGTGTRDQDEVIAKAKGKTLEDAREDMETLREYIPTTSPKTLVRSSRETLLEDAS